ncbi:MAG: SMI1/KNR4 family protein [Verrucomicrobiaceae bacterium]|nr:SMI1/KNR4 family protein [Verrucomicrobiaceae bacterium]
MQQLSKTALGEIETNLSVSLPSLYRHLLTRIGHGVFGQNAGSALNTTKEIYHPAAIKGLYETFFNDPDMLFARYLPFGCDNQTQELWIIDVSQQMAASIWHETVPDDWADESWLQFDAWERRYLATA